MTSGYGKPIQDGKPIQAFITVQNKLNHTFSRANLGKMQSTV
jgi:hypothetical protein